MDDTPDVTTGDTAVDDADEPQHEPGEVSPAVWVGVGILLVAAIGFAVGRSTKNRSSASDPG